MQAMSRRHIRPKPRMCLKYVRTV